MSSADLDVFEEESPADGGRLLIVRGDLTPHRALALRRRIERALDAGITGVVVDLSDVATLDAASLAALSAAHECLSQGNCRLAVVSPRRDVHKMFAVASLDGEIETFVRRDEALASVFGGQVRGSARPSLG